MNSHRDEQACLVDPGSDGRPEIFDRLLDASSLGAPDVLRHAAMTPPSFFAELDAALDEEHANQAKDQPPTHEGDVDDALLRLFERAAQSIESAYTADPSNGSSRPTWSYPSGSFAVGTFLRPLHETDFAGEQQIRLWYLPAAESRVFVSFAEYESPSKVRALLSALLPSSQEVAPAGESDWNLNVFSNLREDIARSILTIGFDNQNRFEPIVQACSSAIVASHIIDDLERYLHPPLVSGDPTLTDPASPLEIFRRNHAELDAGPVRPVLETGEKTRLRTWKTLLRTAIHKPDEQPPATDAPMIPIAPHQGIVQLHGRSDLVLLAAGSGKTYTAMQAALGEHSNAALRSESSNTEESTPHQLWVCVRSVAAEHSSPLVLVVAPLTSTAICIASRLVDIGGPVRSADGFEIVEGLAPGRFYARWVESARGNRYRLRCNCREASPWNPQIEEANGTRLTPVALKMVWRWRQLA